MQFRPRFSRGLRIILLGALVLVLGVTILAVQRAQELRQKAFTGFEVNTGGETRDVTHGLVKAVGTDFEVNSDLESTESVRGLYYTYSRLFQNSDVEYELIAVPGLNVFGKAFLYFDQLSQKSILFSRITGLPIMENKKPVLWLEEIAGPMLEAGSVDILTEGTTNTTYLILVNDGVLKDKYVKVHLTYEDLKVGGPSEPVVSLKL